VAKKKVVEAPQEPEKAHEAPQEPEKAQEAPQEPAEATHSIPVAVRGQEQAQPVPVPAALPPQQGGNAAPPAPYPPAEVAEKARLYDEMVKKLKEEGDREVELLVVKPPEGRVVLDTEARQSIEKVADAYFNLPPPGEIPVGRQRPNGTRPYRS
jgi:hypothetical protein